jgi:hypothetical protein
LTIKRRTANIATMVKPLRAVSLLLALAVLAGATSAATPQARTSQPSKFRLWEFDEVEGTCRAKGRLQDRGYCDSKMMNQIVEEGKPAIPILISELTDTRRTQEPIYDYWSYTTAGDVAYFILTDLFTDSDWKTFNMPGLELLSEKCDEPAENCWRRVLKEHGRKFVQQKWLAAWNANSDRVYWEEQCRCFRLRPKTR